MMKANIIALIPVRCLCCFFELRDGMEKPRRVLASLPLFKLDFLQALPSFCVLDAVKSRRKKHEILAHMAR